jgi:hypothetical protein
MPLLNSLDLCDFQSAAIGNRQVQQKLPSRRAKAKVAFDVFDCLLTLISSKLLSKDK